jgi:hypothetical protein
VLMGASLMSGGKELITGSTYNFLYARLYPQELVKEKEFKEKETNPSLPIHSLVEPEFTFGSEICIQM